MTSTKGSLSAVWIAGLFFLTLPATGCNVSGTGLGNKFDAADGRSPEANPAAMTDARPLLSETGFGVASDGASEALPGVALDVAADRSPAASLDASPDWKAPADAASPTQDLAPADTRPAADVPVAFEVQTLPDGSRVGDAVTDGFPLQADGSDVPPISSPDTAPADSTPPDLAPADHAPDLSTLPDLRTPDLAPPDLAPQPTVHWVVDNTTSIGGFTPTVLGSPDVTAMDPGTAVCFDGGRDGLSLATNPLQGMERFTVQALVYPEFSGTDDPRVIQLGNAAGNTPRLIIEMRANVLGNWHMYVSFSMGGSTTNLEASSNHASDRWYWIAVTYDGQTARVYVNGALETSDTLDFGPMVAGSTSLGARLNGGYYFPGCMREVEVFGSALPAAQLRKP